MAKAVSMSLTALIRPLQRSFLGSIGGCSAVLTLIQTPEARQGAKGRGTVLWATFPGLDGRSLRCRINPQASISLGLVRDHAVQVVKLVREQFENIIEHTRPLCVLGN